MSTTPAVLPKLMRLGMGPAYFPSNTGSGLDGDAGNAVNCLLSFTSVAPGVGVDLIDLARDLGGLGTMSRTTSALRANLRRCRPVLDLKPTAKEWQYLMAWVTNGTPSGTPPAATTYPLADNRGSRRRLALDYGSGLALTLMGCQVQRATFAAQAGGELTAHLETAAVDWSAALAFPATTGFPNLDGVRFLMADSQVLVGPSGSETAYPVRSVSASINYVGAGERFFNSNVDDPVNADREVTLELELPLGAAQALWAAGGTPQWVRVPFTAVTDPSGPKTVSLQWLFPALEWPVPDLPVRVPDEAFVRVAGMARVADLTAASNFTLAAAAGPASEWVTIVEANPAD